MVLTVEEATAEDSTVVEVCRYSVYRQILEITERMAP